jgi:hypothetical protein
MGVSSVPRRSGKGRIYAALTDLPVEDWRKPEIGADFQK